MVRILLDSLPAAKRQKQLLSHKPTLLFPHSFLEGFPHCYLLLHDTIAMSSAEPEHRADKENAPDDDEDTGAQVAPIVRLEKLAVTTGEEEEHPILDLYVRTIHSSVFFLGFFELLYFCTEFLIFFGFVLVFRKAKLYRFDKEGNQWKERGVGTVKLLKHNKSGKVRLLMRQLKTLKICANHLGFVSSVLPLLFWRYLLFCLKFTKIFFGLFDQVLFYLK